MTNEANGGRFRSRPQTTPADPDNPRRTSAYPRLGNPAAARRPALHAYNIPASARASWVRFMSRGLNIHDVKNAATMTKVASEIIYGDVNELKSRIAAGLNPNTSLKLFSHSDLDHSLLDLAVSACQSDIVHLLVAAGASVNASNGSPQPLNIAAQKGDIDILTFLLEHGANINEANSLNQTALQTAVRMRHLSAVKVLLAHGSNPNLPAGGGGTILDLVSHSSNSVDQAIAKELRKYGAASTLPAVPKRK